MGITIHSFGNVYCQVDLFRLGDVTAENCPLIAQAIGFTGKNTDGIFGLDFLYDAFFDNAIFGNLNGFDMSGRFSAATSPSRKRSTWQLALPKL